mmetsp:Transcript_47692/g.107334  ORF Transcript_47692/g.107334 Transcript_47692/m.107334 type:complete len:211 (+) Transcript_47692:431-1063(+)
MSAYENFAPTRNFRPSDSLCSISARPAATLERAALIKLRVGFPGLAPRLTLSQRKILGNSDIGFGCRRTASTMWRRDRYLSVVAMTGRVSRRTAAPMEYLPFSLHRALATITVALTHLSSSSQSFLVLGTRGVDENLLSRYRTMSSVSSTGYPLCTRKGFVQLGFFCRCSDFRLSKRPKNPASMKCSLNSTPFSTRQQRSFCVSTEMRPT